MRLELKEIGYDPLPWKAQRRSEVLRVAFAFGHRQYIGEHDVSVAC